MAYTPDPADATQPVETVFASTAAAEFRALKGRLNAAIAGTLTISSGQRNLFRNPNFLINQRSTVSATANNQNVCDGWRINFNLTGGTVVASADTVDPEAGSGSAYLQVGTGQAAPAAGDFVLYSQSIEGFDVAGLRWGTVNAQGITISFSVQATTAGQYTLAIRNAANTRSYCAAITLVVGRQPVSITIPGDTAGVWNKDTGIGLLVTICAGSGTTFTAPSADTWVAGNYVAAPGQHWMPATAAAFLRFWEMQLEAGSVATAFSWQPYATELHRAKRYYEIGRGGLSGYQLAGSGISYQVTLTAQKRIIPAVAATAITTINVGSFTIQNAHVNGAEWFAVATAAGVFAWNGNWTADADI